MPVPGEQTQDESRLGDYRLVALLSESEWTQTYRAEQISIERTVGLECLKPEAQADEAVKARFLADVRAKAAVDHPGIGLVYEAVDGREGVYYAREHLSGTSFEELRQAGVTIAPGAIAASLRQVAVAMEYIGFRRVVKLPVEPRHLFLGDLDVVRVANLAVADTEDRAPAGRDRRVVAELFLGLLQEDAPGTTPVRTLLSLMLEQGGTGLTWTQVAHTARTLEHELSEGTRIATQAITTGPLRDLTPPRGWTKALPGLLAGLLAVAAVAVGALLLINRKPPPKPRDLSAMIEIPPGRYLTHDGKTLELPRFWIDAHEVSIAEYAEFLEALAILPEAKREGYDHAEQPATRIDHVPDDWEAMLTAARSGATFEGLPLDPNCPVTGVDWWDAHAYANWKGTRLPTQEEWFAAAQDGQPASASWGPVDLLPGDVTPRGVHGLAGNVSEWVRDTARNPAFPMNPKAPLCCGASYLYPRNGVRSRTWLPNREARRRDIGFRTARDSAP